MSPTAPTATDIAQVWIGAVSAVATLAAVIVAVITAVLARRDAESARSRQATAESEAREAEAELAKVQLDAQREIADAQVATQQSIAAAEAVRVRRELARDRAAPQAEHVALRTHSAALQFSVSGPASVAVKVVIENAAANPALLDITLEIYRVGEDAPLESSQLLDRLWQASFESALLVIPVHGLREGEDVEFGLTFRESNGSRWRLMPSRDLWLLNPRMIDSMY